MLRLLISIKSCVLVLHYSFNQGETAVTPAVTPQE